MREITLVGLFIGALILAPVGTATHPEQCTITPPPSDTQTIDAVPGEVLYVTPTGPSGATFPHVYQEANGIDDLQTGATMETLELYDDGRPIEDCGHGSDSLLL